MRQIPPLIADALNGETATLCRCIRLIRKDGQVLGFTDHDADITFDGVTFAAATALATSDAERGGNLAAADAELAGALSSAAITEDDLKAGKYDGARLEVWLVNWRAAAHPDARMLLATGQLGRVRRGEVHFEAEVRNLAARLQQVRGRTFAHGCDAELGDARCGVNLSDAAWNGAGTVTMVHDAMLRVSGLSAFAAGFFTHGRLRVTTGTAAGFQAAITGHRLQGAEALITLDSTPPADLKAGDQVTLTAGCDKSFATCRDKFANAENFRGFPHMPGNDFVISYPTQGDDNLDGGSMNR
jgi:uncharacterized phage protein (TIGR02218 family)